MCPQVTTDSTKTDSTKKQSNLLFGETLITKGLLTRRQLIEALNDQRDNGGRLGEVLLRLKMLCVVDFRRAGG